MASFVERISVIIDTKADQAITGFKSFRAELTQAQGAAAKFRVAGNAAGNMLGNLAVSLPIVGTYIGGIAKLSSAAAEEFSTLAKSSLDLAAATGLSTEEASRWIAVADDFEITAASLTTAIGKIGKDLNAPKWAEYGIATRDASGEARSANDILIDSLDVLGKVRNGTERARIGQQLFGRQFKELAPLIGKTGDAYRDMLGAVSEGQVITDKEAKKAEEWRLAQDELSDSLRDMQLILGELVVEMAPLLTALAKVAQSAGGQFVDAVDKAEGAITGLKEQALEAKDTLFSLDSGLKAQYDAAVAAAAGYDDMSTATHDARLETAALAPVVDDTTKAMRQSSGQTRKAKEALEGVATATAAADREFDQLLGTIDNEQAWLDLLDTLDDYNATMADSTATDNEKARATLNMREALILQLKAIEDLPAEKRTDVLTLIDQGSYDEAAWIIGELTKARDLIINPKLGKGAAGSFVIKPGSQYAHGTKSAAPGMALVGEQGPELVMMGGGERVFTASETARMTSGGSGGGTYNITVNAPSVDAEAVVRVLQEHIRRNGGVL